MAHSSLQKISVALLDFDPKNPRFLDITVSGGSTEEHAMRRMMEQENLDELVGSIGNHGFFPGEPLLVVPHSSSVGRYQVVEGNRRLAALRVLGSLQPHDQLTATLRELVAQAQFKPTEVACFVFAERRDVLKYLGFRHISGPRRWEPLAKARYLADLIQNFYADLPQEEQLRAVAKDIGSRRDYVAQLLTTLNLYDRAKTTHFYGLQRVDEEDINFSVLSTALSYSAIVDFLNLPRRDAIAVDTVNDAHAKELLSWMFAQDPRGATVLGESRRLKLLAAVVESEDALAKLRKHHDLDQAYLYTSGPAQAFSRLLSTVEAALVDSINLLSGDAEPDASHAAQMERITDTAESLQLLIQKAIKQRGKRARLLEAETGTP